MQAIRQIKRVKNRTIKITVHLPEEFPTTDQVEVIILPAQSMATGLSSKSEEQVNIINAVQHLLTLDTSHFTPEQQQAYERAKSLVQQGRLPHEPRILGLFEGLMEVSDDFDSPLPDEDLFWGEDTDETGLLTQ